MSMHEREYDFFHARDKFHTPARKSVGAKRTCGVSQGEGRDLSSTISDAFGLNEADFERYGTRSGVRYDQAAWPTRRSANGRSTGADGWRRGACEGKTSRKAALSTRRSWAGIGQIYVCEA